MIDSARKETMLLAIDIGNSNIVLGVFEGAKLRATWRIATGSHKLVDEYAALLLNLLSHQSMVARDIKEIALCSVVPSLVPVFEELCQRYFGGSPLVVEAGIKTGVRICMDNPLEVGADRVANAVAAHHLYGGPVVIIDLGTATTFDTVSEEGAYIGGIIAPGIVIAAEALSLRAAKLPQVELERPKRVIGTNTVAAMQSGIIFGYIGLVEGIIARIERELGSKPRVVATGGFADTIAKDVPAIEVVNTDLTLIGLRLIHEMNRS